MNSTVETQKTLTVDSTNLLPRAPRVWEVGELRRVDEQTQEQHYSFVLATSALEAIEIIGTDESREINSVRELCPITQLPTDKYRPVSVVPPPWITRKASSPKAAGSVPDGNENV